MTPVEELTRKWLETRDDAILDELRTGDELFIEERIALRADSFRAKTLNENANRPAVSIEVDMTQMRQASIGRRSGEAAKAIARGLLGFIITAGNGLV